MFVKMGHFAMVVLIHRWFLYTGNYGTWLIYANRCWLIGAVDGQHERRAQNVFAHDRLSFTREHELGHNNEWCPELPDLHARDCEHVTSSHAHWISEFTRGSVGAFHGSTGKCGLNKDVDDQKDHDHRCLYCNYKGDKN
jgi:hypothetical protein